MSIIVSNALRKLGFADINIVHDGQSALSQLRLRRYGLILSDWEMGPMGGEEFLKELRRDPVFGKIPVVVITAQGGRGASWLGGAKAYLGKPFTDRDFETAIKVALE